MAEQSSRHDDNAFDKAVIFQSTKEMASQEDVWDLIYEFATTLEDRMSDDTVYNEVYAEDNQNFPQLFIAGYPDDGFSKEVALELIQPLIKTLESMGWFLAKHFQNQYAAFDDDEDISPQILLYFGRFPRRGRRELVSQRIYHISPSTNRENILAEGLKASCGGSDFIQTADKRLYVILDEYNVDDVIGDIRKHRPGWDSLDVWMIDAWSCQDEWYEDIELPEIAGWTPHDIPASAISFMRSHSLQPNVA